MVGLVNRLILAHYMGSHMYYTCILCAFVCLFVICKNRSRTYYHYGGVLLVVLVLSDRPHLVKRVMLGHELTTKLDRYEPCFCSH